ncbi:MAG: MFS transporter [Alphaproteobacteria bacterium]|nr:MFS transporter [Alphaproteobacteria bacterium]
MTYGSKPTAAPHEDAEELQVVRKAYRRVVWFLVVLFICSYLDRINMSFAALSMNKDLGLNATMFASAASIFYIAYVAAEIPSNMMLPRFGAKIWIPRIMITWGMASAATALAVGPNSLYVLRALVGLAEAGFMPGILLYMTYWFPPVYLARASALFIMAQPITIMFGSFVSGGILEMNGVLGLAGWQWLFILEGLPSVIFGVIAYFYLSNTPADAAWLAAREKQVLIAAVERGGKSSATGSARSIVRDILSWPVALLALTYFCLTVSLATNSAWVPQIVRGVVPDGSYALVGFVTAIPSFVTICVMPFWGDHSDRRQERIAHVILPMLLAGLGWSFVALFEVPLLKFVGLVFCSVGGFAAQSIFWTLPPNYLSPEARPIGIAFVNTIGLLGTTTGLMVMGWLRDLTHSFAAGLLFVAGCMVTGSVFVFLISGWSGKSLTTLRIKPPRCTGPLGGKVSVDSNREK